MFENQNICCNGNKEARTRISSNLWRKNVIINYKKITDNNGTSEVQLKHTVVPQATAPILGSLLLH